MVRRILCPRHEGLVQSWRGRLGQEATIPRVVQLWRCYSSDMPPLGPYYANMKSSTCYSHAPLMALNSSIMRWCAVKKLLKHIHKTGSTQHIIMPPAEDWTAATGKMQRKCDEIQPSPCMVLEICKRTDIQTVHTHAIISVRSQLTFGDKILLPENVCMKN